MFCNSLHVVTYRCSCYKIAAAADVDNIARTLDFNTLQDNIMNITFCSVESELVS